MVTLVEALKLSNKVRLSWWPEYYYYEYVKGEGPGEGGVLCLAGTEARRTTISVQQAISDNWEVYPSIRKLAVERRDKL